MVSRKSDVFDRLIDTTLSAKNAEVQELLREGQLYDRVVTEVSPLGSGRKVKIAGRWITDFASCNYLGLDLRPPRGPGGRS